MTVQQELELVIDKLVEEFDKLKKENQQLWSQLEKTEREKDDLIQKSRELELRLETENSTIEALIKRVKTSLDDAAAASAQ